MAATLIVKPIACVSSPPPPLPSPYASSFRLWTPFLRGGRGIFSSTLGNHYFLHSRSYSSSPFSSLTGVSSIATDPNRTARFDSQESENDPISIFNERILREQSTKRASGRPNHISDSNSSANVTNEEVDKYIQLVKQQQQRGLRELKKGHLITMGASTDAEAGYSYKVDPFTLEEGDYVVHKKVGIGRFISIRPSIPEGSTAPIDYVYIQYADGVAKLPVKQASRFLYRYNLPNENRAPRGLGRLKDTSGWEKRRIKGKVAVQKMVVDLMEVYLNRLRRKRPPYPKNPGMAEFVSQFPYDPTPDQQQAFIDVEKDLTERETPMDRLICGDVGFGKTEVAQRAIFCVVSAGKQAMLLAPTIVLAKQHFGVISERFSKYPDIKVGIMSRYQTRAEREEYFHMIEHGHLDIIVGTHSLLGSRVVYDRLGLLIVDEEQRFGVKQKEMIASFKTSVDVLALSATPIPRTLYLALTGFRDCSLISTPPPQRVPVKTHLSEYSEEKVISAIKYELDRGGQVFYVLPRIQGLEEVLSFLEKSFPDVEIAIAHGQLYSKRLEKIMTRFVDGEIKILISTNIVESGLDIQNANTIVIQDFQQFGLAQLYQLRGRVGRTDKEAHAHLFYPNKLLLSPEAKKRLTALEECSDLGQGLQLAERDMAIRGFGDIFGVQQTGDIGNVGIDLFFEMLFESLSMVDVHRTRPVPYESVKLELDINPRLSSEYINYLDNPIEVVNDAEKAAEKDTWSLVQFTVDLRRQYGKEPYAMEVLLKKLYVRRMAADIGITTIYIMGKTVGMKTNMGEQVFKMITEAMLSDVHRNMLAFEGDEIKAELLIDLPRDQLLTWIFHLLAEIHSALPTLIRY
ncbi:ATP-dependent DNA helicase At3g02060, chloroplastic isoform X1 [Cynara cardunculus var. scolymus]|uniref:ATP-dependent DNA helicase At3g02060, chloroplastic isoform X1 n=1 Tax=Cynara cardunculus var. scolymus TaxID=59895 RepID=UPI000D62B0A5|nr:ATP-dependent DNA helicase At3g02060, chloroplastic isoform X1 [Cynara cardunculus var. scolymus]